MFRLFSIIDPGFRVSLATQIDTDMQSFFAEIVKEPPDLKSMGLKSTPMETVLNSLRAIYEWSSA